MVGTPGWCLAQGQSQTLLPEMVDREGVHEHHELYLDDDVLVLGGYQLCEVLVQYGPIVRQAVDDHLLVVVLVGSLYHQVGTGLNLGRWRVLREVLPY